MFRVHEPLEKKTMHCALQKLYDRTGVPRVHRTRGRCARQHAHRTARRDQHHAAGVSEVPSGLELQRDQMNVEEREEVILLSGLMRNQ